MNTEILVIGAGLAGSEAAWQIAERGVNVRLAEMRPNVQTPAHNTGLFAELVCSNSLRSNAIENAVGLLKEEMRRLGSLVIKAADDTRLPAGGALAVDREAFAHIITAILSSHPRITVERREITMVPREQDICIVAAGPLASPKLTQTIGRITGSEQLYFYDAVAPIISLDSIAMEHTFWGSRYDKGEARSYLNCILTKEEYFNLWTEMVRAEQHPLEAFEEMHLFEGCMPIEELARRGPDTMRYGPLKPVGLKDPKTGKQPYAVVQLRRDNQEGTLYNMVGFQTRLKWNEQARVFGLIPALKEAEFVRYGVMHRNTFVNSPRVLKPTWQLKEFPTVFFAGQITGVEGYVESAASGLIAGVNAARLATNLDPLIMPTQTACGALANYITTANPSHFQPMNINFGLFPPLENRIRNRRQRNLRFVHRALEALENYWQHLEL